MTFGKALKKLKSGRDVFRNDWCSLAFVTLYNRLDGNPNYLVYTDDEGHTSPWYPTTTDLLAEDWDEIADEAEVTT